MVVAATDLHDGKPEYGKVVVIETNGDIRILLAHLDNYYVTLGQRVSQGAKIATVGNTGQSSGPHVHIETYESGQRVDPSTVLPLDKCKATIKSATGLTALIGPITGSVSRD